VEETLKEGAAAARPNIYVNPIFHFTVTLD